MENQKKRFLARIDAPDKNWKFSQADVAERKLWDTYMDAYFEGLEGLSHRSPGQRTGIRFGRNRALVGHLK